MLGFLCVSLTLLPVGAGRAAPDDFAGIDVSEVDHPDTRVRWGRAEALIAAPLQETLDMVEAYGEYADVLPSFNASKVLSQRGTAALVYFEASVAAGTITFWSQMRVGPRTRIDGAEVIDATMLKGNPKLMEARWELVPVDDQHTRVAFQLLVVPDMPLPAGLVSSENASAAKKVIRAVRSHLENR